MKKIVFLSAHCQYMDIFHMVTFGKTLFGHLFNVFQFNVLGVMLVTWDDIWKTQREKRASILVSLKKIMKKRFHNLMLKNTNIWYYRFDVQNWESKNWSKCSLPNMWSLGTQVTKIRKKDNTDKYRITAPNIIRKKAKKWTTNRARMTMIKRTLSWLCSCCCCFVWLMIKDLCFFYRNTH